MFKPKQFPIIGNKNNQSAVSDADRGILTTRPTDNAGNSVSLVSGIIHLFWGSDFFVCVVHKLFLIFCKHVSPFWY